jgi:hypothetical protein
MMAVCRQVVLPTAIVFAIDSIHQHAFLHPPHYREQQPCSEHPFDGVDTGADARATGKPKREFEEQHSVGPDLLVVADEAKIVRERQDFRPWTNVQVRYRTFDVDLECVCRPDQTQT